jgi:Fe-S cluster assembly ATP-binding protein
LISQINENGFLHLGGDALDSGEVNTLHG